jgi:hypothetical protein
MATSYLNAIATQGASVITHVGLVNGSGTELSGGAYARKAVTWTAASNGQVRLAADQTFDIPAGSTVAGWRGFTALTAGTNHGGGDLTSEVYASAGQYVLTGASTGINHAAV